MEIINRNNYEIFIVDFLDGNLSSYQEKQLFLFLSENPDIKNEFDALRSTGLSFHSEELPNKSHLKKTLLDRGISKESFEEFCIAESEGDLTIEEKKIFKEYIDKNIEYKPIKYSYRNLKLKYDKNILFVNKELLKRKRPFLFSLKKATYYSAVAASVIMVLIFFKRPLSEDRVAVKQQIKNERIKGQIYSENKRIKEVLISSQVEKEQGKNLEIEKIKPSEYTSAHKKKQKVLNEKKSLDSIYYKYNNLINNDLKKISISKVELLRTSFNVEQHKRLMISSIKFDKYVYISDNNNIKNKVIKFIKTKVFKEPIETVNTKNLNLWDIADASIRGINEFAGWNIRFERETNEQGKTIAINYSSRLINYSKKFGNK